MSSSSTIHVSLDRASNSLEVYLLGCVDFDSALFLQERLVHEISARNDLQGGLLLCEHPPLISVGREGSRSHLLVEPRELVSQQMEIRWVNRGGGCLVHAPGQLAVYPIVPLDRLRIGLAEFRHLLEESIIDVSRELRVPAWRRTDEPGIWCRCGQFASLGVAVKSWVAYHGLFINVCPAPQLLKLVQSNRSGERMTSLATQRLRVTSMHKVRESLVRNLAARLGYEHFHLYTGHPLLRRIKRRVSAANNRSVRVIP